MNRPAFISLAILVFGATLPAQTDLATAGPPGVDPVAGGQALAEKLRSSAPAEDAEFSGMLNIRRRDGQSSAIPVTCKITTGQPSWQVVYETRNAGGTAAEKLVIVHKAGQPNEYLHARAAAGEAPGPPARLGPEQIATPLAGSDFWLMDLGLEFFHWPRQRIVKTEMRKSRSCDVLESINPHPAPRGYARVVSWLDKETGGPIMAEAYDQQNKLVKEFSLGKVGKVDGQWQLKKMEIRDVKSNSRTTLEFDLDKK